MRQKCKCDGVSYSRHHRKPRSLGGRDDAQNISILPRTNHQAWHTITSNHTPETIAAIINEKYLDPDYEFICQKKQKPP